MYMYMYMYMYMLISIENLGWIDSAHVPKAGFTQPVNRASPA